MRNGTVSLASPLSKTPIIMKVFIQRKETASLIIDIVAGQYESVLWRQFDSPSPGQEAVWWHEAYVNDPGVVSLNFAPNVDGVTSQALKDSRMTADDEARAEHFATVQEQLTQDLPYVWLSHT